MEVEYQHLTVEAEALETGRARNPSLWKSVKGLCAIPWMPPLKTAGKKTVKLLDDVYGVLKPGRMTLLLGPPGAGKSLFLQTLSGRLRHRSDLQVRGSIKYNGESIDDFVVQRTAGYVDQCDTHIPNMTVIETVNFAAQCQIPEERFIHMLVGIKDRLVSSGRDVEGRCQEDVENTSHVPIFDDIDHAMADIGTFRKTSMSGGTSSDSSTPSDDLEYEDILELIKTMVVSKANPYIVLNILGLGNVLHTYVGDESLRGVSGGEKKRLTLAETLVGPQWAIYLDAISNGLDSATTYSVVKSIQKACHTFDRTVVISLTQPAPEVFDLFDDVILLTDGKVLFHGPIHEILPFFSSLGFDCPARKDPGAFLQEVTTLRGQLIYASADLLAKHGLQKESRTCSMERNNIATRLLVGVDDIERAFRESTFGKQMASQLEDYPYSRAQGNPHALSTTEYASNGFVLGWYVLKRQVILLQRDWLYYMARSIQAVITGLVIASFASVEVPNSPNLENYFAEGRKVISLCVLSIMYLSLSSMPAIASVFSTKAVFYKQRDNRFFPSWSYSLVHLVAHIPASLAETLLFSASLYWIAGLENSAGNFFIFYVVTWSCSNCLAGIFRFIAYISNTMGRAVALGSLILLLLMLTNGFTIVRTSIPEYLIWIYYGLNPLSYGVRALAINELTSPTWGQAGEQILGEFAMYTDKVWIWASVLYSWGFLMIITIVSSVALQFWQPENQSPYVEDTKRIPEPTRDAMEPPRNNNKSNGDLMNSIHYPKIMHSSFKATTTCAHRISLVCKNIRYYVTDPVSSKGVKLIKHSDDREIQGKLQLLKVISFYVEPGKLTALMGGSGAGKTTLMDILAFRKTIGVIRGDIMANGRRIRKQSWSRVVGYVEQSDVHSPYISVHETLHFASRLRLPDDRVSNEEVLSIVDKTISMIELDSFRDLIVGFPESGGLSMEQRKRLSIGLELVSNPSVLFMDEPTSGLDARSAAIVTKTIRNVADTDRTVMVTIHQPSTEIFETFDMLVLLQRGGRLAYFGPIGKYSSDIITYFQSYPGVKCIRPGHNPATWMMEVIGKSYDSIAGINNEVDFPYEYSVSKLRETNDKDIEQMIVTNLESSSAISDQNQYATSSVTQVKMLLKKYFSFYWRATNYNFTRMIMTAMIALIYGLVYLNQALPLRPSSESASTETIQNILGLMFSLAIFNGMYNCVTVMPIIFDERSVYYRHRSCSLYSPKALALAQGLVEIPYLLIQAMIMVVIVYWMAGFQADTWKFFYFYLTFFLCISLYTFLGQCLVIICPNQVLAQLLAAFLNQMWTIFNGFLIPYPQTPAGWKWMSRISPTSWVLYGFGATQLADSNVPLAAPLRQNQTVGSYVQEFWGYDPNFSWWCILIIFAYVAFFRTVASLSLVYISYARR